MKASSTLFFMSGWRAPWSRTNPFTSLWRVNERGREGGREGERGEREGGRVGEGGKERGEGEVISEYTSITPGSQGELY